MRRVLVCTALALVLAGCGGTGSIVREGSSSPGGSTGTSATPADSGTSTPSPDGGAGCGPLPKQDLATVIVGMQLLAQVRDKDTLDSITGGTLGKYSPEELGAVLAKMSFLTGDAADGLAQIVAANEAVKILAAGSPSQADLDAYQQQIGGVAGILKSQLAVNLGIAQACPGIG